MATYNDPTDLIGQEREAERDALAAREIRRKELEDLRWLLGHPQGRRIAGRLLKEAGVFRSSFNTNGLVMALQEGKRHMGLFITDELITASADGYMKVLKEFKAKNDV